MEAPCGSASMQKERCEKVEREKGKEWNTKKKNM